jgi:hypothetical protein
MTLTAGMGNLRVIPNSTRWGSSRIRTLPPPPDLTHHRSFQEAAASRHSTRTSAVTSSFSRWNPFAWKAVIRERESNESRAYHPRAEHEPGSSADEDPTAALHGLAVVDAALIFAPVEDANTHEQDACADSETREFRTGLLSNQHDDGYHEKRCPEQTDARRPYQKQTQPTPLRRCSVEAARRVGGRAEEAVSPGRAFPPLPDLTHHGFQGGGRQSSMLARAWIALAGNLRSPLPRRPSEGSESYPGGVVSSYSRDRRTRRSRTFGRLDRWRIRDAQCVETERGCEAVWSIKGFCFDHTPVT